MSGVFLYFWRYFREFTGFFCSTLSRPSGETGGTAWPQCPHTPGQRRHVLRRSVVGTWEKGWNLHSEGLQVNRWNVGNERMFEVERHEAKLGKTKVKCIKKSGD